MNETYRACRPLWVAASTVQEEGDIDRCLGRLGRPALLPHF
jgi:hypothetical protein